MPGRRAHSRNSGGEVLTIDGRLFDRAARGTKGQMTAAAALLRGHWRWVRIMPISRGQAAADNDYGCFVCGRMRRDTDGTALRRQRGR